MTSSRNTKSPWITTARKCGCRSEISDKEGFAPKILGGHRPPYSLGCATVGALYERPRCTFCAKPTKRHKSAPNFVFSCAFLWLFLFQNVMAFNEIGYHITVLEVALARVANAILPGFCAGKVVSS